MLTKGEKGSGGPNQATAGRSGIIIIDAGIEIMPDRFRDCGRKGSEGG